MIKICLIRHGKTAGNLKRKYIGRTDEPLCAEGKKALSQAIESGRYPESERLFVSPMTRCIETATMIYPNHPYRIEEDLRECDFGMFEGKTYEELKNEPEYQAFLEHGGMGDIPKGESVEQMKARCHKVFCSILSELQKDGCQTASIVCHGGTIMAILEQFSQSPKGFYDYQIENCGAYICMFDEEQRCFVTIEKC